MDTTPRAVGALLDPMDGLDEDDLAPIEPLSEDRPDDLAPVPASNALDLLRADLADEVKVEEVTLPVPGRPNLAVRYACDVDGDELVVWRKRSTNRQRNVIDEVKLGALALAFKSVAILRNGVEVTDGGEPVTFRHPAILTMTGQSTVTGAIRYFYGLDGHVLAAANKVLTVSGFGDELTEVDDDTADPTKRTRP